MRDVLGIIWREMRGYLFALCVVGVLLAVVLSFAAVYFAHGCPGGQRIETTVCTPNGDGSYTCAPVTHYRDGCMP